MKVYLYNLIIGTPLTAWYAKHGSFCDYSQLSGYYACRLQTQIILHNLTWYKLAKAIWSKYKKQKMLSGTVVWYVYSHNGTLISTGKKPTDMKHWSKHTSET
ncbi:MAG TPA: hypothetical protein VMW50_08230 [Dehalococcoidia bacterium]|nr:hypothetical protein [Dehalococcoidia bacterium]